MKGDLTENDRRFFERQFSDLIKALAWRATQPAATEPVLNPVRMRPPMVVLSEEEEEALGRMKPSSVTVPAQSESSAPIPGPATKPWRSGTVSRLEIGWPTIKEIMVGIKSTKSMPPELAEFWEDSMTLRLTLRWPTLSTETGTDGEPGPVNLDVRTGGVL